MFIDILLAVEIMTNPLPGKGHIEHSSAIEIIAKEAGTETTQGMAAIAEVIINRVNSHYYPNTVIGNVTMDNAFESHTRRASLPAPTKQNKARAAQVWLSYRFDYVKPSQWILEPCHTMFINPTVVKQRNGGKLPNWWLNGTKPITIGNHEFRCEPRTETAMVK